jgi:hypothetical protein
MSKLRSRISRSEIAPLIGAGGRGLVSLSRDTNPNRTLKVELYMKPATLVVAIGPAAGRSVPCPE